MSPRQWRKVCHLEAIASLDNLWLAAVKARRGKSRRSDVEAFELRRESELLGLRAELLAGSWRPGPYHFFEIFAPKRRMIAAAPYRDRVVHHALCNGLQPVLERRFIARSYSCQVGKGTTAARECCRRLTMMIAGVFAWYQFSREGNTRGLRRAYAAWPFDPHKRRRTLEGLRAP